MSSSNCQILGWSEVYNSNFSKLLEQHPQETIEHLSQTIRSELYQQNPELAADKIKEVVSKMFGTKLDLTIKENTYLPFCKKLISQSPPKMKEDIENTILETVQKALSEAKAAHLESKRALEEWECLHTIGDNRNRELKHFLENCPQTQESLNNYIHYACKCENANEEIISILLKKGAQIDAIDNETGQTFFHLIKNNDVLLTYLLEKKPKKETLNHVDQKGWTPLNLCQNSYPCDRELKCTRLLLEKGADPNIKRPDGETLFEHAFHGFQIGLTQYDLELMNLLIDYGADVLDPQSVKDGLEHLSGELRIDDSKKELKKLSKKLEAQAQQTSNDDK